MSWTSPDDLNAQIAQLWERGTIPSAVVTGEVLFPKRLRLKVPSSAELAANFAAARAWASALTSVPHVRIERRTLQHRVLGANELPSEAWIDTLDEALAACRRATDAEQLRRLRDETAARLPALVSWIARYPLRALDLENDWSRLLSVCEWMLANPRPGIYLRQVDVPGVHSKFIQAHRGTLAALLDLVLAPAAIDASATGVSNFERRYGFRSKPAFVRVRVLDPAVTPLLPTSPPLAGGAADLTLDADTFAALDLPVTHVFVTENETNFLSFPSVPGSLVVFGAGYGMEAIGAAPWLARVVVHYWGDIDTHGFAILAQLRAHLPHARSMLMDEATLLAHPRDVWSIEATPVTHLITGLTADEHAFFRRLQRGDYGAGARLEQERVGFERVERALRSIHALSCTARAGTEWGRPDHSSP